MKLVFTNYRRGDTRSLDAPAPQLAVLDGFGCDGLAMELVDVADSSGVIRYQTYFFTAGECWVFAAGGPEVVVRAHQHSPNTPQDMEQWRLWAALGEAYQAMKPPIRENIDFRCAKPEVHHPELGLLRLYIEEGDLRTTEYDGVAVRVHGRFEPEPQLLEQAVEAVRRLASIRATFAREGVLRAIDSFESGAVELEFEDQRGALSTHTARWDQTGSMGGGPPDAAVRPGSTGRDEG